MKNFWNKWGLCLLLFLSTTLNYLDRQTLSLLAPVIQKEMHFGNEGLGWLFSIFYYAYTLSQFGIGFVLDRTNLRWTFGVAVLAWSTVAALTGLSAAFSGLMVFRLLLGIMESANWPSALRIVAGALPPSERTLGTGIFQSGTSVGALIAPGLILTISAALGWRWAFVAVGSLGALWLAAWLAFTRRPELAELWTQPAAKPGSQSGVRSSLYRDLFCNRQFWRVGAVAVLVNPILYFNVNWLPTYFVQQRGLPAGGRQLALMLTLIYLSLGLGYLGPGTAILWLTRRGRSVRSARRMVFLLATVLLALTAAVPSIRSLAGAVVTLVVVNFGVGMWISIYLTLAQEVSRTHISTVAGLLGGSGSLVGAMAMWAVGKVTQATASFSIPMSAVALGVILAAIAGWTASRQTCNEEELAT